MQMKRTLGLPLLLLVLVLIAGWIAGTYLPVPFIAKAHPPAGAPAAAPASLPLTAGAPAAPSASRLLPPSLFSSVPDVRQSTGYTCGASALQAILAYWGTEEREDRLAARLKSTPEAGTHPLDIVRVAREFGLTADLREGLDLADLERALADGATVIVDLQAWRDRADIPWTETWDDGHYMVLLGMDAANLYFEDPSLLGARGVIPRAEFVDRWHDYEGDPPLDPSDQKYSHMAIFLKGDRPAPARPATFEPVR
jgi:predicted double-glycine peptidase